VHVQREDGNVGTYPQNRREPDTGPHSHPWVREKGCGSVGPSLLDLESPCECNVDLLAAKMARAGVAEVSGELSLAALASRARLVRFGFASPYGP